MNRLRKKAERTAQHARRVTQAGHRRDFGCSPLWWECFVRIVGGHQIGEIHGQKRVFVFYTENPNTFGSLSTSGDTDPGFVVRVPRCIDGIEASIID